MKLVISLIIGVVGVYGQTMRLRVGGPESSYRIQSISNTTPAEIRVVNNITGIATHDFVQDDYIFLHDTQGCGNLNYKDFQVKQVTGSDRFTVKDLAGNDVACGGVFDFTLQTGMVGKTVEVSLASDMGQMMWESGDTRNLDPDGAGPLVAPVISDPWMQRMITRVQDYITVGCDPAQTNPVAGDYCTNAASRITANDVNPAIVQCAIQLWRADNSRIDALNVYKFMITRFEKWSGIWTNSNGTQIPWFVFDKTAIHGGVGSGSDWIGGSGYFPNIALAYALGRDQLTSTQRNEFVKKMTWDWQDGCIDRMGSPVGLMNVTNASTTVTGSGFSSNFAIGDNGYVKTVVSYGGSGLFFTVTNIVSDTEMVVSWVSVPSSSYTGRDYYKISPWTSNSCGAWTAATMHSYFASAWDEHMFATTTSAISTHAAGDTLTFTVSTSSGFPSTPFMMMHGAEVYQVTNVSGNTITATGGMWYSTPAAHATGTRVFSFQRTAASAFSGPYNAYGEYTFNLNFQKNMGLLLTALSMSKDSARAREWFVRCWNYFYDLQYPHLVDMGSPSAGAINNGGYMWGRWAANLLPLGGAVKWVFDTPIDILGDWYWRGLRYQYLISPPNNPRIMPVEPRSGSTTEVSLANGAWWFAIGSKFNPGVEAARALYHFFTIGDYYNNPGGTAIRTYPWLAAWGDFTGSTEDYRLTANPWEFSDETEIGPTRYNGMVISRSGWTADSGLVIGPFGGRKPSDHQVDLDTRIPGSLIIFKGPTLLVGQNTDNGSGAGTVANSSGCEIGVSGGYGTTVTTKSVSYPWWYTGVSDWGNWDIQIAGKKATNKYLYVKGDFTNTYQASVGVTLSQQTTLHIRNLANPGGVEYVLNYQNHKTAAAKRFRCRTYYVTRLDAGSTFSDNGDATLANVSFTKPTVYQGYAGKVNTRRIYASGPPASITTGLTATLNNRYVEIDNGTGGTGIRWFEVHRTSTNTGDAMPVTSQLSTINNDWDGVEIKDSSDPIVVTTVKDGTPKNGITFTSTYSGMGRLWVMGLASGTYDVVGPTNVSGVAVGSDGVLYVEGLVAGAYSIGDAEEPPPEPTGSGIVIRGSKVVGGIGVK